MKLFYVSAVLDDEIVATSPSGMFREVVAFADISKFATENTLVGYNKVTGKLAVKTKEETLDYLKSKLKLAGASEDTFACLESNEPNLYYTHSVEDSEQGRKKIILNVTDKGSEISYDLNSIYDTIMVNWSYGLSKIDASDIMSENEDHVDLCINLDIESYAKLYGNYNKGVNMCLKLSSSKIHLKEINLVNKDMFSLMRRTSKLFKFKSLGEPCDDFSLDLRDFTFNPEAWIHSFAYNLRNVELPPIVYSQINVGETLLSFCSFSNESYSRMVDLVPSDREYIINCPTVDDLKLSEVIKNRKLSSRLCTGMVKRFEFDNYNMTSSRINLPISLRAYKYIITATNVKEILGERYDNVLDILNRGFFKENKGYLECDRKVLSTEDNLFIRDTVAEKLRLLTMIDLSSAGMITTDLYKGYIGYLPLYSDLDEEITKVWCFIIYMLNRSNVQTFKIHSLNELEDN